MSDTEFSSRTYWLVGASDGLGAAIAKKLSAAGATVILSARSADKLNAMSEALPGRTRVQPMDLSDTQSVRDAAAAIGPVDGVVLVAGQYWPFGAKDWKADEAVAMADVNFTGFMRVLGEVMPGLVERDAGHIVIISSLVAFRGLPGSIGYTASKAATLSLAESMYADLRKTGIKVQVALPGFIRTRLTDKNDFHMPFIMEPEDAAREIFELMCTDRFKKSFPRRFAWLFRLAQLLPDGLYFRLFS